MAFAKQSLVAGAATWLAWCHQEKVASGLLGLGLGGGDEPAEEVDALRHEEHPAEQPAEPLQGSSESSESTELK